MNEEEFELLRSNFLSNENYLITYLKNNSGNVEKIKNILQTLRGSPVEELKKMAEKKFNSIENGEIPENELERAECELTLLLMCIPPNLETTKNYWLEKVNSIKQPKTTEKDKVLIEIGAQHPLIHGKPGEEFAARLDRGIELYNEELSKGNEVIIYIPGSTHSIYDKSSNTWQIDDNSLSKAGFDYLVNHGIPAELISSDAVNEKYKTRGVYNSGDECFVSTSIARDESCNRIISVNSPVQLYRKALFYLENGYKPEIYSVPLSNTYHNYVGELFWSLYVTYMEDHTWQEGFLAEKTREERNVNYKDDVLAQTEEVQKQIYDILSNGLNLPEPVYSKKAEWLEKYSNAKDNMSKKSLEPSILIEADFSEENFDRDLDILCQSIKKSHGKNCIICTNNIGTARLPDIQARLDSLNTDTSFEFLSNTDRSVYDIFSNEHCSDLYIVCSADKTIRKAIDGIKNGIVPQVFSVPSNSDDFISEISQMYSEILTFEKDKSETKVSDIDTVLEDINWKEILANDTGER